ncbi:Ankyrin repeat-containing domain [Phytophthora cactorum]|nr:Ankyrin repeat-containing domain [Phytophthora cactorum]
MWLFANHRHQLGRDRLRIYALGKFYILHWLKIEAGASEREAFMGEANPLAKARKLVVRLMQYVAAREDPDEMNTFYRRWLFNAATEMAAGKGDLESLKWLMESYLSDEFSTKAVAAAAANGHLGVLQWLYEKHHGRGYWNNTEICGALTNGHIKVVEWLRTHAVPRQECMAKVMDAAAGAGNLDIVKWLHEEHKISICSALSNAMSNCQWETSQWILEHRELVLPWISWDQPAKNGTLRFLKFLRSYSIGHLGYFTLQTAAEMSLVRVTPDAMKRTAQNGHLDVVEWFHENGCEGCDVDTLINTAGSGHLDVVKWLDKHGVHPTGTAG